MSPHNYINININININLPLSISSLLLLDLSSCPLLTDLTCSILRNSTPHLLSLDLSSNPLITDHGIIQIMAGCSRLSTLLLRNLQSLTDLGLACIHTNLKVHKAFRLLDFSGSLCFSNEGLLSLLSEGGGVLASLSLDGCAQLTDLGMMGLRRFGTASTNLKRLSLRNVRVHDSSMTWLAEGCSKLDFLDLGDTKSVTDECLGYLSDGCCRLRTLVLRRCSRVTDRGLEAFLPRAGKFLTMLDLTDCSR